MKHHVFALVCSLTALGLTSTADAKLERSGSPSVSFTAAGPGGLKIVGSTSQLEIADDGKNVIVTVPLANLTTGICLRDRHMRDKYLEVPKYPNATLRVARADLKFPAAGAESSGDVTGTMQMHGESQPVTIHYRGKRDGNTIDVTGSAHVDLKAFKIEVPTYLGVTVKPDVELAVHFGASGG